MSLTLLVNLPSGLSSCTVELYPEGSDTIANGAGGDALTEASNRKGLYSATVAETLNGLHYVLAKNSGGVAIATGFANLINGQVCRADEGGYGNQVWRRFKKRVVKDATTIKTYADDASTVIDSQGYTSASGTDTVEAAS